MNYPNFSLIYLEMFYYLLGWSTMKDPVNPSPVIILTTPGGNPASLIRAATLKADNGVYSAGFKTTVHPILRLKIWI